MTATLVLMLLIIWSGRGHSDQSKVSPSSSSYHHPSKCPLMFYYNSSTDSCQCFPYQPHFICEGNDSFVHAFYILTFDRKRNVVTASESRSYRFYYGTNVTNGYRLLPKSKYELNNFMCGPMNRIGSYLCSDCINGFGPSMSMVEHPNDCYRCRDNWHGVILYLVIVLVPVTLFYLIILFFQISFTSAPLPCFVMYSQLTSIVFTHPWGDSSEEILQIMFTEAGDLRAVTKVILVLYGIFNLDFITHAVPPFCISSKLTLYHRAILGYITAFYPMLLILVTWICIELHDRNFRLIVFLWRPFHRCFVRLRRGWDIKNDLIEIFTNFFLLSYVKIFYQTILMTGTTYSYTYSLTTDYSYSAYVFNTDCSISTASAKYVIGAVSAGLISTIFNLLPALLLVLYPVRFFRKMLSKLRLDRISLMIFMEKFHCCYRDGLGDTKDMRSFSGIYFFLVFSLVVAVLLLCDILHCGVWFFRGTLFLITAVLIALCRPYKKMYMNVCDTLLLSHLALICYMFSLDSRGKQSFVLIVQVILLFPFAVLILVIFFKLFRKLYSLRFFISRWEALMTLVPAAKTDRSITNNQRRNMNMYGAITT